VDCQVYGNGRSTFRLRAEATPLQILIDGWVLDATGGSGPVILDDDHNAFTKIPALITRTTPRGSTGIQLALGGDNRANLIDVVCSTFATQSDVVIIPGRPPEDRVRVQDCAGRAYQVTPQGRTAIAPVCGAVMSSGTHCRLPTGALARRNPDHLMSHPSITQGHTQLG
jgi:hypothetical protein